MLKKSWTGTLIRNARNDAGQVVRRYEFPPGGVQEVHEDDLLVVSDDVLNGILLPVKIENFNPVVIDIDREKLQEQVAKLRGEAKAKALRPKEPKAPKDSKAKGKPDANDKPTE